MENEYTKNSVVFYAPPGVLSTWGKWTKFNECGDFCVAIVSGDGENFAGESGAGPMESKERTQNSRIKLTLQSSWHVAVANGEKKW